MRTIKVIFLDFGGVVQTSKSYSAAHLITFDRSAIEKLNQLIEKTSAYVVVTSELRRRYPRAELQDLLNEFGFLGTVLDKTPVLSISRGEEIKNWLKEKARRYQVESFVILDDGDFSGFGKDRLVRTSYLDGLQDAHVTEAEKILNTLL